MVVEAEMIEDRWLGLLWIVDNKRKQQKIKKPNQKKWLGFLLFFKKYIAE